MGRQDQGLVGRAAPTLAACLQGRTQPLQSTVPSLGQLQSKRPCLPQWVRVDVRAAGCGWGWKLPCQSQQDWMELEALVLGAHPCAPGLTHSQCRKVHTTPSTWHEPAQPQILCTYRLRRAGASVPQTRAVQGRPRETSRRKEPPRLRPPEEPLCRAGSGCRRCHRSGSGGECWGQAQGAAVFPQLRLPSKSNIVGTRQAPCTGSTYMGLS